jgi:hypothetical protein
MRRDIDGSSQWRLVPVYNDVSAFLDCLISDDRAATPKSHQLVTRLAMKHGVAAAMAVSGSTALAIAAYAGLFAYAAVAGEDLGGPLTLPFLIVATIIGCTGAAALVFFPATTLAEWADVKAAWPRLAQIPMVTLLAAAAVTIEVMAIAWLQDASLARGARASLVIFAILLIPLGIYWWSLQAADAVINAAITRWRATFPANLPVSRGVD